MATPRLDHGDVLPAPDTILGFRCIQVLDWLQEGKLKNPSILPDVRTFLAHLGLSSEAGEAESPDWLPQVLSMLEASGLVKVHKVFSSYLDYSLQLTDLGMRDVAERADRRRDRPARRAAARRGVLRWLDEVSEDVRTEPELQTIFSSPWGTYEGTFFSVNEVVEACAYLIDKGLISNAPLGLTTDGRDCVDTHGGHVSEYLEEQQPRPMNLTNNFHGMVNNLQLAQGNKDVQQNQSVQGVNAADMALLAQALREAAPALGLSDSQRAELEHVASRMADAATGDEVEPGRAEQLMSWGRELLADASGSALAQLLQAVMGNLGGG